MATLTVRQVPDRIVEELKRLAERNHRSMEQEVRELLSQTLAERASVIAEIEAHWAHLNRRPSASEVDRWIEQGR